MPPRPASEMLVVRCPTGSCLGCRIVECQRRDARSFVSGSLLALERGERALDSALEAFELAGRRQLAAETSPRDGGGEPVRLRSCRPELALDLGQRDEVPDGVTLDAPAAGGGKGAAKSARPLRRETARGAGRSPSPEPEGGAENGDENGDGDDESDGAHAKLGGDQASFWRSFEG